MPGARPWHAGLVETTETQQPRPQRGDELELTIDSLAFGGAGVARTNGYVVFVSGAVPGDRVRAVIGKRKRAYAEARTVEIVEPSRDRIDPVADHPGAPWQVLPYERQLEVKQAQVDDALRRIGKLDGFELEQIVPAVQQWRYRNKLEYSFGSAADGALVCGFHAPGRWDEIVGVSDCLLASEPANEARDRIVTWCRAEGLSAYDRHTGEGQLRNLVVREGRRTEAIQVRLVTSGGTRLDRESLSRAGAGFEGLLWTRQDSARRDDDRWRDRALGRDRALRGGAGVDALRHLGAGVLSDQHGDGGAALRARGRVRARDRVRARLRPLLRDRDDRAHGRAAGGGGLGARDWSPKRSPTRSRNARANEVDNARFFAGDVRLALRELVEKAGRPDVVIVDPPRAGPVTEGRASDHRGGAASDRLRVVQPDDAGAERRAAGRGGLPARTRAPRRHVSADAAHRVRRGAGPGLRRGLLLPSRGQCHVKS